MHFNTTFEDLATAVSEVLSDQDFEMQEVLNDYLDYCYHDKLITSDDWKYMRMQLASTTLEFNMAANVYYDSADRGFRPHTYLGLYKDKSVRAIGKIDAILRAVVKDGKLELLFFNSSCSKFFYRHCTKRFPSCVLLISILEAHSGHTN